MFGLISDLLGGAARLTGSIIGLSVGVVATALGITESMVREAKNAGCKTYEEIRKYHNL